MTEKSNNSKRHHYIPKFFIKNFTDEDGKLFVYTKEKDTILKNKQSPKGIFFEDNRNLVNFSGHMLDNLEQFYSELDSKIATDYLNAIKNKIVTPEELTSLTFLANLLKWRVPKSDLKFNELKSHLSKEELAIKIQINNQNNAVDENAISHIENSDIFKESKRILLSILPLLQGENLLEIHNHSFFQINTVFPSLIGDNPVIMENCDLNKIGNFIFPLSSDITFIYKQKAKREMNNGGLFCFHRDLTILNNSSTFIGCENKEHLEKVIKMYKKIKEEGKTTELEQQIFKYIE
jgi:hypothetical protein